MAFKRTSFEKKKLHDNLAALACLAKILNTSCLFWKFAFENG
jgi:hypothetical protein